MLKLLPPGLGAVQRELEVGATPDSMLLVHAEDRAIHNVFTRMGRVALPTDLRLVNLPRVVNPHRCQEEEINQMLKAFKGYPFFASM